MFANEKASILPNDIKFEKDNSLVGVELSSLLLGSAVKFFIATAALLSKDFDLAETLLSNLSAPNQLRNLGNQTGLPNLRNAIENRFFDLHFLGQMAIIWVALQ